MWTPLVLSIAVFPALVPQQGQLQYLGGRVWRDDAPLGQGSFRMTCVLQYLDSRGDAAKTLTLEHRSTFARGRVQEVLLSAREDGRDVTERERRKASAEEKRRGASSRWLMDEALAPPIPFLIAGAAAYEVALAGGTPASRLTYRPLTRSGVRAAEGWVDLDPVDGLPLLHRFVPIPLPKMIGSMVTTVRYQRLNGIAVPASTESMGEGGFLFIKRRFRVTMTYYEWEFDGAVRQGSR